MVLFAASAWVRLFLFGRLHELALAQQRIYQSDAGGKLIVGLTVLMKLLFALSDHSLGVDGMPFLKRQPRQGEFRFRDRLLISSLFAESQRFLVRVAGCLQIPLIDKHVSGSSSA